MIFPGVGFLLIELWFQSFRTEFQGEEAGSSALKLLWNSAVNGGVWGGSNAETQNPAVALLTDLKA